MNKIYLLKAELVKIIGDLKAYWLNYLFGNLNVFFLFLGIFYAFPRSSKNPADIFNLLIGLMLWYYGVHAIDLIAIIIEEEAEEGTLEQIFMTKTAFIRVLFYRIIAQFIFDTIKGVFVFVLCLFTFKIPLEFITDIKWLPTLFIFIIALAGLYGIGYIIAGLSILYKRVSEIAGVSSNLLLFFSGIIISLEKLPATFTVFAKSLPLYWGISSLNDLVNNGFKLGKTMVNSNFIYLIITASVWILIGIAVFNICQRKACKRGSLSQY